MIEDMDIKKIPVVDDHDFYESNNIDYMDC